MGTKQILAISVGAAVVAAAAVGSTFVTGADADDETVFVPIVPCRLVDTRPDTPATPAINVGPRSTKIGEAETVSFNAWESDDGNSPCEIPETATAIATNAVAVQPTAQSFLTLWPAGNPNPGTANLNFVGGQAPTPNSATVPLSSSGAFSVFNASGSVHLVLDVSGFYQPSSSVGEQGPEGETGPAGPPGPVNRISDEQIALYDWGADPGRPGIVTVGIGPRSTAFANGKVYVPVEFSDEVAVIDPVTNTEIGSISIGSGADGSAWSGSLLYVSSYSADTIWVIDPDTDTVVTTIDAPDSTGGIAYAGGKLYATANPDKVYVIDPTTNAVIDTLTVGAFPVGIERVGTLVYVANNTSGTVSVIDTASDAVVDTITVDASPLGMAYTGRYAYVANIGAETVSIIDPSTGTVVGTLTGPFDDPTEIAYDGRYLYVTQQGTGPGVAVVDPMTGDTVEVLEEPGFSYHAAFDGTNVWVIGDGAVHKLLPY